MVDSPFQCNQGLQRVREDEETEAESSQTGRLKKIARHFSPHVSSTSDTAGPQCQEGRQGMLSAQDQGRTSHRPPHMSHSLHTHITIVRHRHITQPTTNKSHRSLDTYHIVHQTHIT